MTRAVPWFVYVYPCRFQGARGSDKGAEWFVENFKEELDFPMEYFYEKATKNLCVDRIGLSRGHAMQTHAYRVCHWG